MASTIAKTLNTVRVKLRNGKGILRINEIEFNPDEHVLLDANGKEPEEAPPAELSELEKAHNVFKPTDASIRACTDFGVDVDTAVIKFVAANPNGGSQEKFRDFISKG